tara:strand:- start:375 stop:935 length:561 start_codon:yes stop_codon:yes gene_type:complete
MFYEIKLKSHIRVSPSSFSENTEEAVLKSLNEKFEGYVTQDIGFIIAVISIDEIGDGIIIPGDGAPYYDTTFTALTFKPEIQEIVLGKITDITDFGAFIEIGPLDGMIHIGQTMDDYVSFSKENVLSGKETKRSLKVNDLCRARIIAISFKDPANPKIGLTMRQPWLGNVKWIEEELKTKKKEVKK